MALYQSDIMELKEARIQLHQAAQMIAAVGVSYAEHKEDDSHTNMALINGASVWAGAVCPGKRPWRLALDFAALKYLFLDAEEETVLGVFQLHGQTFEGAREWLLGHLAAVGADPSALSTTLHYDIPDDVHDYATYRIFDRTFRRSFRNLAAHFLTAQESLTQVLANRNAGRPRIWPHHFDLGALITLDSEAGKSVGLGLSPGDSTYNEPYYYVSPWPYPEGRPLNDDDLAGTGFWHTAGFTAAVLKASDYTLEEEMSAAIIAFLESAVRACEDILTAGS